MAHVDAAAASHQAWDRFEEWLATHSPADHVTLQPPATSTELQALEEALGFALHPELAALLQRHNGVAEQTGWQSPPFPAGSFLPLGHRLDTTRAIDAVHQQLIELEKEYPQTEFWAEDDVNGHRHQWVSFAHSNDGGLAFIDHRPGPTYGHVYEFGLGSGAVDPIEWAPTLTQFIENLTTCLTDGIPFKRFWPETLEHPSGDHCIDWGIRI